MGNYCRPLYVGSVHFEKNDRRLLTICSWKYGTIDIRISRRNEDNCGTIKDTLTSSLGDATNQRFAYSWMLSNIISTDCVFKSINGLKMFVNRGTYSVRPGFGEWKDWGFIPLPYHLPGSFTLQLNFSLGGNATVCSKKEKEKEKEGGEQLILTYLNSIRELDSRYSLVSGTLLYSTGNFKVETDPRAFLVDIQSGVVYPSDSCGDGETIIGNVQCFQNGINGQLDINVNFQAPSEEIPTEPAIRIAVKARGRYKEFLLHPSYCDSITAEEQSYMKDHPWAISKYIPDDDDY